MCPIILSGHGILEIIALAAIAVAIAVFFWAIYNLILGWGDQETYRHVRKLFLRWCLGLLAVAWLLDQIVANCAG
ncbi:MAG: hypothetical protein Q8R35_02580 [bacterium]|nr:hypothetical protein [bacterium]